ncbi:hypothetical protein MRX96_027431 [Rhipicephalus microplus]
MSLVEPDAQAPPGDAVSAVSLRLPQFWERHIAIWFLQVEAQFITCRITPLFRKFHYVVSALPPAAAEQVSDTLVAFRTNLPAAPYEELKAALLDRTASSERARNSTVALNCGALATGDPRNSFDK